MIYRVIERTTTMSIRPSTEDKLPDDLAAYVSSLGYVRPKLLDVRSGSQATCYLIDTKDPDRKLVIKLFSETPEEVALRLEEEYKALHDLHASLGSVEGVTCPEPIEVLPRSIGLGYLMTLVEGLPLWTRLQLSPPSKITETTDNLVEGMMQFHQERCAPYGEFSPENLLITEFDCIGLLDPGCPTQWHRNVEVVLERELTGCCTAHRLLAMDIGYWMFTSIARSFSKTLTSPRAVYRMWQFSSGLLEAAERKMGPDASMGKRCFLASRVFARQLSRKPGVRSKIIGICTLLVVHLRKKSYSRT